MYSNEQAKTRGQTFGNELKVIQDDLKNVTHSLDSKISMFKEGNIDRESFLEFTKKHEEEMGEIISRYNFLLTPKGFEKAVELFKLSSKTQLQSDIQIIEWVRTANNAAHIRSDTLLQESFEYEMAALAEYKRAQGMMNP
ncbi:hypothetical protein AAA799O18_00730 [Marine Group I thaumarchaeote SCGC AAA799-O18]|nr:hypothetical protein AAA799O18_00730 [Marine Group I thaumarchaeote SCGC AAA799-O18]